MRPPDDYLTKDPLTQVNEVYAYLHVKKKKSIYLFNPFYFFFLLLQYADTQTNAVFCEDSAFVDFLRYFYPFSCFFATETKFPLA